MPVDRFTIGLALKEKGQLQLLLNLREQLKAARS